MVAPFMGAARGTFGKAEAQIPAAKKNRPGWSARPALGRVARCVTALSSENRDRVSDQGTRWRPPGGLRLRAGQFQEPGDRHSWPLHRGTAPVTLVGGRARMPHATTAGKIPEGGAPRTRPLAGANTRLRGGDRPRREGLARCWRAPLSHFRHRRRLRFRISGTGLRPHPGAHGRRRHRRFAIRPCGAVSERHGRRRSERAISRDYAGQWRLLLARIPLWRGKALCRVPAWRVSCYSRGKRPIGAGEDRDESATFGSGRGTWPMRPPVWGPRGEQAQAAGQNEGRRLASVLATVNPETTPEPGGAPLLPDRRKLAIRDWRADEACAKSAAEKALTGDPSIRGNREAGT